MIAIIDFDIGNLAAVSNMLHRVGAACAITRDPDVIARAEGLILPGNGAFDSCMRALRATGLVPLLEQRVLGDRVPLLGICVGAQMLGRESDEGTEKGLGWMDMSVRRFPSSHGLPVPHMGWNEVQVRSGDHPLLSGLDPDARFYFVHSYYLNPGRDEDVILSCNYGVDFAAAVSRDNIAGVQFHPEKSHRFGKQLLGNFARQVTCTATG